MSKPRLTLKRLEERVAALEKRLEESAGESHAEISGGGFAQDASAIFDARRKAKPPVGFQKPEPR